MFKDIVYISEILKILSQKEMVGFNEEIQHHH